MLNFEYIKCNFVHSFIQIQHIKLPDSLSEVFLFEDTTIGVTRMLSKGDYQRSIVRQILSELLGSKVLVAHEDSGAPYIIGFPDKRVSISHSKKMYAIQLSEGGNVGIDIQVTKKGLAKGKDYFVNNEEEELIEMTERNLHLIWSAKEAVYKRLKGNIDKYKEGMVVNDIQNDTIVVNTSGSEVKCGYIDKTDFVMVYVM